MKFLREYIKPRFGYGDEEIVYQKIPTFRVQLPGNVAVGDWHKDKDYRNLEWANKVQEVNYYLPFTNAYGTNTIWTESEEDKGDFKPIEIDYGQCVEWYASKLTHGNKDNLTSITRVSMDFRVIPMSRYVESKHTTINTKTPFSIGEYYEVL
jgi:ectoine hydroxylase-related dioxygenase (phytanoyl-CoA dioxygenase family)